MARTLWSRVRRAALSPYGLLAGVAAAGQTTTGPCSDDACGYAYFVCCRFNP